MSYYHSPTTPSVKLRHSAIHDGKSWLHRKDMLLPPSTWRQLTGLAEKQKVSESEILIRLLNIASAYNKQ